MTSLLGTAARFEPLAFSPDGQRLVSGGVDHTIRIWDVTARRQVGFRRGHAAAVNTVAVSSDGQSILSVAVTGAESIAKLWNLARQEEKDVLVERDPCLTSPSPRMTRRRCGDLRYV